MIDGIFFIEAILNSKQLIYFQATADLKSIAAASRKLDVAQPSITLQIDNLEHELGCVLFTRDYKGMQLTESGEKFYQHASAILRQIEQSKSDVSALAEGLSGRLIIGMNQPTCNSLAVPLVALFKERYPDVDLDLRTSLSFSLNQALRSGEIDLAISSPDGSDMSGLDAEYLFRERLFVVMGKSPNNPALRPLLSESQISFTELAKHELLVTSNQDSLGHVVMQFEKTAKVSLRRKRPFGQLMTSLRYVTEGHGLLLTPSSSFFHLQANNQIHALEVIEPELWRDVYIMKRTDRPETQLLRTASRLIREVRDRESKAGHWLGVVEEAAT